MRWISAGRLTAVVVGTALAVAGCGAAPPSSSSHAGGPAPGATGPAPSATDDCPELPAASGGGAAVDYADVVRFTGRQYLAYSPGVPPTARPEEVGDVVLRIRCSFGELNQRTGQMPPPLRDGDSGWLPAGTEVHGLRGWPSTCRLVAQQAGRWLVYAATDPTASPSRPAACTPTATG